MADWHTHTVYSDGMGTVEDNARAAQELGLESVAVTDHGPAALTAGMWRAETLLSVLREVQQVRGQLDIEVLAGVEANVVGTEGDIDVPPNIYEHLDLLSVGIHPSAAGAPRSSRKGLRFWGGPARRRRDRTDNTKALISCLHVHPVDLVTHPGLGVDVDTQELARAAEKRGTALEISARYASSMAGFIDVAQRTGVSFWCSSDAHEPASVGDLRDGLALARARGLAPERICNTWAGRERGGAGE